MCLQSILDLLNPPKIPYPVIKPDYTQTVANTDLNSTVTKWLFDYAVPQSEWAYWRSAIKIEVFDNWPQWVYDKWPNEPIDQAGALTYNNTDGRHLLIKAPFLNTGVMAHEQAHNSYALLALEDKNQFTADFAPLFNTDKMVRFLYFKKIVTTYDTVEIHAEIYRYLGTQMPNMLKRYYPKLLEV